MIIAFFILLLGITCSTLVVLLRVKQQDEIQSKLAFESSEQDKEQLDAMKKIAQGQERQLKLAMENALLLEEMKTKIEAREVVYSSEESNLVAQFARLPEDIEFVEKLNETVTVEENAKGE